jgi:F-type H+-transporting ATPase subunit epsilon
VQLEILLPFTVFLPSEPVSRIVAVSSSGSFGLLPRRLDCVAALSPGILSYSTAAGQDVYLAIDRGVLFKSGAQVRVCVRRAIGGTELGELRKAVDREFLNLDERERSTRSALAVLESGFIRRFLEVRRV